MSLVRADALAIPLADASVDLVVSSPPYFALRSYADDDGHYDGQIGSEATPADFLAALWAVMDECWRVLKPGGSAWINLGDKYAGSGGNNNSNLGERATLRGPSSYGKGADVTAKSLMGLPWRFVLGLTCPDPYRTCYQPGEWPQWVLRSEVLWDKPNGLPESVTDRVRRSHEQWFHVVKQGRYFAALDEIREGYSPDTHDPGEAAWGDDSYDTWGKNGSQSLGHKPGTRTPPNPLGKLPGSVWRIPSQPLSTPVAFWSPDQVKWRAWGPGCVSSSKTAIEQRGKLWRYGLDCLERGEPLFVCEVDHFAAFPVEWPRRIILGWSPSGICTGCGEGRRPVVEKETNGRTRSGPQPRRVPGYSDVNRSDFGEQQTATITGYSCDCPTPDAPTRPAVILDPFAGTGTTILAANALGRYGIGLDLSAAYLRLARWRTTDGAQADRVRASSVHAPSLFGDAA